MLHFYAKYKNNYNFLLREFQNNNYNPEILDEEGFPAISVAVRNNNELGVSILLSYGVDTNILDKYNCTPLHWACLNNNKNLVKILLINYAKTDIKNALNKTPIDYIVENKNYDLLSLISEVASVKNLVDLFLKSVNERNHKILKYIITFRMFNGNEEILLQTVIKRDDSFLLYKILKYLDVNCPIILTVYNKWIEKLSCDCIKEKSNNCFFLFIDYLKDLNYSQYLTHGETFIHHALRNYNDDAAKILINKGANPIIRNVFNMVPMHYAILYNRYTLLNFLKEYDFDINIKDNLNGDCFLEYMLDVPEYTLFFHYSKKCNLLNLYTCKIKIKQDTFLHIIKLQEINDCIFEIWKYFLIKWFSFCNVSLKHCIGHKIKSFLI